MSNTRVLVEVVAGNVSRNLIELLELLELLFEGSTLGLLVRTFRVHEPQILVRYHIFLSRPRYLSRIRPPHSHVSTTL